MSSARQSTVEAQPLIAVRNVRASSRWYAKLLGADSLPDHGHRDVYARISRSGRLLLQLHAWDAGDHPNLVNAGAAPPGYGVLLWFQVATTLTRSWSELASWERRLLKNRMSILRPDTVRFGSAMPMVMWWWWPVRTVNAVRNLRAAAMVAVADHRASTGRAKPRSRRHSWRLKRQFPYEASL